MTLNKKKLIFLALSICNYTNGMDTLHLLKNKIFGHKVLGSAANYNENTKIVPIPKKWVKECYTILDHCGVERPEKNIIIHGIINVKNNDLVMAVYGNIVYINMQHFTNGLGYKFKKPFFFNLARKFNFYHEAVHLIDNEFKTEEEQEVRADLQALLEMDKAGYAHEVDKFLKYVLVSGSSQIPPYLSNEELVYHGLKNLRVQRYGKTVDIVTTVKNIIAKRKTKDYCQIIDAFIERYADLGVVISNK